MNFQKWDFFLAHPVNVIIVGRKNKGRSTRRFHSFLQAFEKGLLQKILDINGKELPINTG